MSMNSDIPGVSLESASSVSTVKDNPSRSSSMRLASKRGIVSEGELEHVQPLLRRGLHRARLEWRNLRRHEEELVERERFACVAGGEQMADVRRIERPAQDAEAHGRLSLVEEWLPAQARRDSARAWAKSARRGPADSRRWRELW